jgi:hypothetical protein
MTAALWLRITLVEPPAGVWFGIQRGRSGADPRALSDGSDLSFEIPIRLKEGKVEGSTDFSGEYVQGRPGERFVYISIGKHAGDTHSCWDRRAKIYLHGIPGELSMQAVGRDDRVLEAWIPGRARDGGPVCASVKLLDPWKIVDRRSAPS